MADSSVPTEREWELARQLLERDAATALEGAFALPVTETAWMLARYRAELKVDAWRWKAIAEYLADCHAGTASYEGNLRRTSRSSRQRMYYICSKALAMLEGREDPPRSWAAPKVVEPRTYTMPTISTPGCT